MTRHRALLALAASGSEVIEILNGRRRKEMKNSTSGPAPCSSFGKIARMVDSLLKQTSPTSYFSVDIEHGRSDVIEEPLAAEIVVSISVPVRHVGRSRAEQRAIPRTQSLR
jgi:hypothetical protein